MKNHLKIVITLIFIIMIMSGCGTPSPVQENNGNSETGNNEELSRTDGVVYDDISTRFSVTVYPTKIINENGERNIVYSADVDNKSEETYKNFFVTLTMNDKLDQYIAAGAFPRPSIKVDLAAKGQTPKEGEGKGVESNFQQILSDEQFMSEAGIKYEDILELGRDFELWFTWDGGEEKHKFSVDVIDESGASDSGSFAVGGRGTYFISEMAKVNKVVSDNSVLIEILPFDYGDRVRESSERNEYELATGDEVLAVFSKPYNVEALDRIKDVKAGDNVTIRYWSNTKIDYSSEPWTLECDDVHID